MIDFFENLPPYLQALVAGIITWLLTRLGVASVFIFKSVNKRILTSMQGFVGHYDSPTFGLYYNPLLNMVKMVVCLLGYLRNWLLFGGIFIRVLDSVIPHLHQRIGDKSQYREGVKTSLSKNTLLVLAITLHNIPEGLSIGVAFGGIATGNSQATFLGALGLAIGIGIQNIPEGAIINAY